MPLTNIEEEAAIFHLQTKRQELAPADVEQRAPAWKSNSTGPGPVVARVLSRRRAALVVDRDVIPSINRIVDRRSDGTSEVSPSPASGVKVNAPSGFCSSAGAQLEPAHAPKRRCRELLEDLHGATLSRGACRAGSHFPQNHEAKRSVGADVGTARSSERIEVVVLHGTERGNPGAYSLRRRVEALGWHELQQSCPSRLFLRHAPNAALSRQQRSKHGEWQYPRVEGVVRVGEHRVQSSVSGRRGWRIAVFDCKDPADRYRERKGGASPATSMLIEPVPRCTGGRRFFAHQE